VHNPITSLRKRLNAPQLVIVSFIRDDILVESAIVLSRFTTSF